MSHSTRIIATLTGWLLTHGASTAQVTLEKLQTIPHPGPVFGSEFGERLAVGDANGDGHFDLAASDAIALNYMGQGWVMYGPDFLSAVKVNVPGLVPGDLFGFGVWVLGDIDGDGADDLLAGAQQSKNGGTAEGAGKAFVSRGPGFQSTIELATPNFGLSPTPFFGASGAIADVTGDGVPDVVVGSPKWNPPQLFAPGRIDVFSGLALQSAPVVTITGSGAQEQFGGYIVVADRNGDGMADIATNQYWPVPSNVTWLHGSSFTESYTAPSPALFGPGVMRFEDMDLDGVGDLVVATSASKGAVVIFDGPLYATHTVLNNPSGQTNALFGIGMDIGDVDRDGFPDIVVSAMVDDVSGLLNDAGRAWIFFGPDHATTQLVGEGDLPKAYYGADVAVRDLDHDGFAEVFVSQRFDATGGRVMVYGHRTLRALAPRTVSIANGGSVPMALEAGPLSAGRNYLVMLSVSGTDPGTDIPFRGDVVHLPLNIDAATQTGLAITNSALLSGFLGVLDAQGSAGPTLALPPGLVPAVLFGTPLTFAAVVDGPSGAIEFASHAVEVTFVH
ncbi:MAG: FG-GAP-like repeat-containing protein [Planctomycetota bacterium JB042]